MSDFEGLIRPIKDLVIERDELRSQVEQLQGRCAELEDQRLKLPHDVVINGGMTFRKGVALRVFVKAAERWHRQAMDQHKPIDAQRLRDQADEIELGGGDV